MKARTAICIFAATLTLALNVALAGVARADDASTTFSPLGKVHVDKDVKCADCHGTARKSAPVALEKCLACNGKGDSKALAAKTAGVKPLNPHENRHYGTEADCGLCHRQHEDSVNFCRDCHPRFDFKVK